MLHSCHLGAIQQANSGKTHSKRRYCDCLFQNPAHSVFLLLLYKSALEKRSWAGRLWYSLSPNKGTSSRTQLFRMLLS